MIVIKCLKEYGSNPKYVAPLTDTLKDMVGKAYTEKAFELKIEEMKLKAKEITHTKVVVEIYHVGGQVSQVSIRREGRLDYFAYAQTLNIDHVAVENIHGEVLTLENKAEQALYNIASRYGFGVVDSDEKHAYHVDLKKGGAA